MRLNQACMCRVDLSVSSDKTIQTRFLSTARSHLLFIGYGVGLRLSAASRRAVDLAGGVTSAAVG